MIEDLRGTHEIVNYKENTQIRLYDNRKPESYPPHWHAPFELIMPTEGTYQVICKNETFHLRERDILLICPYVIHNLIAPPSGRRIIFQPYLETGQTLKSVEAIVSMITPAIQITPESHPDIHRPIADLMLQISDEYFSNKAFSSVHIYSHSLSILALVGRKLIEHPRQGDWDGARQKAYMEKFMFICNYITEHCTEEISLEQAAHLAGFSKYHFSRLFKEFTKTSYYKYLNQRRISLAAGLLSDPQLSVTEIALRSGYASATSFIRMFKLMKQCTPTEFRRMYREGDGEG